MLETIKTALIQWNIETNERRKLQHTYIVLFSVLIIAAGLITLISPTLGYNIVVIGIFGFCAFIANGLIWNLLQSLLLAKLPGKPKRK